MKFIDQKIMLCDNENDMNIQASYVFSNMETNSSY